MSLRAVPPASHPTTVSSVSQARGAPSVRSVPDTVRNGPPGPVSAGLNSQHPLEARLKQWDHTQHQLKMETLRRLYGAAEPIKREMEVRLCADYVPAQLGGASNLHRDILENRDTTIDWEDVFKGDQNVYELPDFHTELEARCRMNW